MTPSTCVNSTIKLQVEEEGGGARCLKVAGSNKIHLIDVGVSTRPKDET